MEQAPRVTLPNHRLGSSKREKKMKHMKILKET